MKCFDVSNLMSAYVDEKLPDTLMRKIKFHIGVCKECRREYNIWKESSEFFRDQTISFPIQDRDDHASAVSSVMERIEKEEKWALPITRNLFHIPSSMKRWLTSISVLFLLVFGVMMFGGFGYEAAGTDSKVDNGEWREIASSEIILSMDQLQASPTSDIGKSNLRYKVIASLGDPLDFRHMTVIPTGNMGLVAGFFGIMVTVVSMSWLSRS